MNDQRLSVGEYLAGSLWLGAVVASCALAVYLVLRRVRPELRGSSLWLARATCLYGLLLVVHLLPAMLGVLSRPAVLACSLLALTATRLLPGDRSPVADADPAPRPSSGPVMLLASAAALAAAAYVIALFSGSAPNPVATTDVATFDLPTVARWIQEHSIWQTNDYLAYSSHGAYPHNSDFALLFFVLPWSSDFAARGSEIAGLSFVALAAYALARQLRATRALSLLASVSAVTIPIVSSSTVNLAMPDAYLYAPLLAGIAFLVRHARSARRSDLYLGGLGLGLAFGGKWYGISCVIVVLLVWLGARWLGDRQARARLPAESLSLIGLIAVFGGIWLVRNLAEYGNPLFPVHIPVLGFTSPTDPLRAQAGESLFGLLGDPGSIPSRGLDPVWKAFALVGPVALAGLLWGCGSAISSRTGGWSRLLPIVSLAGLGIGAAYLITPYTAGPETSTTLAIVNSRYAVAGLIVGLAVLAASARSVRSELITALLLTTTFVVSLLEGPSPSRSRLAVAFLALLALGALTRATHRQLKASPRFRAPALAFVAIVILIATLAGGYRLQETFAANRLQQDPTLTAVLESAPAGSRIGVAGSWTAAGAPPVLSALGPRLQNPVRYLGASREGLLYPYETRQAFLTGVEAARLDYVLIGLAGDTPPVRWSRALGPPLLESSRFALYAVPAARAGA